jgi:hypothetical protein
MKVFNIDRWYEKYHKHILLAQAFTETKELSFIIKGCRLKPLDIINRSKGEELVLHNQWADEFRNLLVIENKKVKLYYNQLSLLEEKTICTDIYYGLPIYKISKISKLLYIFSGIEDIDNSPCIYLCFLGIDNYLRCYLYMYQEWQQVSCFYLGLDNLKLIANHADIKYFSEINNKNYPTSCLSGKTWITSLPVPSELKNELSKSNNLINDILERKI